MILKGQLNIGFELLLFFTQEKGTRTLPVKVIRMWRAAPLDLAVLGLGGGSDLPPDHRWKVPAISLLPPRRGTEVLAFGFPRSTIELEAPGGAPTLTLDPSTSVGEVVEIHHEFRDSGLLPFPCFRTNARFDGGMSSRPVINNSTGRVCGVICSTLPGVDDDDEHVSHVSTLWPIVVTPINAPRNGEESPPTGPSRAQGLVGVGWTLVRVDRG